MYSSPAKKFATVTARAHGQRCTGSDVAGRGRVLVAPGMGSDICWAAKRRLNLQAEYTVSPRLLIDHALNSPSAERASTMLN